MNASLSTATSCDVIANNNARPAPGAAQASLAGVIMAFEGDPGDNLGVSLANQNSWRKKKEEEEEEVNHRPLSHSHIIHPSLVRAHVRDSLAQGDTFELSVYVTCARSELVFYNTGSFRFRTWKTRKRHRGRRRNSRNKMHNNHCARGANSGSERVIPFHGDNRIL